MAPRVSVVVAAFSALSVFDGTGANMIQNQPSFPPQLPPVESVLTKAVGKAGDFASQSMAMQKMVEESQQKGRETLAKQKADYESQLKSQAATNNALSGKNVAIGVEIRHVREKNDKLEEQTAELQEGNIHMRRVLQQISDKVGAAETFVTDSLKVTDDTESLELLVLKPTTPRPTLTNFLAQASLSLLQIRKPSSSSGTAQDLVQLLSHSLADIAEAQMEGVVQLKDHFLTSFGEGKKRQEALLAEQVKLNTTLDDQMKYQAQLTSARDHLNATRESLKSRLHGLRIFARKLDKTAHDTLAGPSVQAAQSIYGGSKADNNSAAGYHAGHGIKDQQLLAGATVPAANASVPATSATTTMTTTAATTAKLATTVTTTHVAAAALKKASDKATQPHQHQAAKKEMMHKKAEKHVVNGGKVAALVESGSTKITAAEKTTVATTSSRPNATELHGSRKAKKDADKLVKDKTSAPSKTKQLEKKEPSKKQPVPSKSTKVASTKEQPTKEPSASRLHSWLASWR